MLIMIRINCQENTEHLNKPITTEGTKQLSKNLKPKKRLKSMWFYKSQFDDLCVNYLEYKKNREVLKFTF